jgi:hypothetical protein
VTPNSRSDISGINKRRHPYDKPRSVSMHRFLGYDFSNITSCYIMFFLDFFLLIQVFLLWKPLALSLIYLELFVSLFAVFIYSIFSSAYENLSSVILNVLFQKSQQPIGAAEYVISSPQSNSPSSNYRFTNMSSRTSKRSYTNVNQVFYAKLQDYILCIASLSLLLRFLSFRPSHVPLRKHKTLVKLSLFYRIFRHII